MKLVFLYGLPGVGKLTVAEELANLTHFKVFHNHLAVDLVASVFDFGTPPFVHLREMIWLEMFATTAREGLPGLIFTFAPEQTVRDGFVQQVCEIVESGGGLVVFVKLTCDEAELERRLLEPSRAKFGKLGSVEMFRELKNAGAFAYEIGKDGLTADTTTQSPSSVAQQIAEWLNAQVAKKLTEKPTVAVHEAYSAWASTYDEDRNLTRDLDQRVTEQILGSRRWGSIIETGCGTGKNTALLARIGSDVLALDLTESMIERAREKVKRLALDNVTFKVADLTQPWPCESETADLVSCNLVLEHIADLRVVFREAIRCLKNGGTFFVSELHPFRQYLGTKAKFQHANQTKRIDAYLHDITEFLKAAEENGLSLASLNEWRHEEDQDGPPRLISFEFQKG